MKGGRERGKQKERRKREGEHVVKRGARSKGRRGEEFFFSFGPSERDRAKKEEEEEEEEEERGKRGERGSEKRAHGHRKSGALHSHAKSSDGGVCSHPGDVATERSPPRSLQITATDNKQLFTCWMRVGDETKVFCHRGKCAPEQTRASLRV